MAQSNGVFRRTSSGWVDYNTNNQIYRRTSSGWDGGEKLSSGLIFRRNSANNGWDQIYPLAAITVTPDPVTVSSAGMNTKQKSYTSWRNKSTSYHGWCIKSSAGGEQFGLISAKGSDLPGSGSITQVPTFSFSGKSGAAGNYTAAQKLTLRGSTFSGSYTGTSGSGDPFGTHDSSGTMTYSWNSTGANSAIPAGSLSISNNTTALNWMNNVSGYGRNLCMYNGETSSDTSYSYESTYSNNYLGVTSMTLTIGSYSYEAYTASLSRPDSQAKVFLMSDSTPPQDDNYLNIALPINYEYDTVEGLIEKYESGEMEYISASKAEIFDTDAYTPVIYSINEDVVYTGPIFDECIKVQYLYNGEWHNALNTAPRRFIIRIGCTEVRIYDTATQDIYYHIVLPEKAE